MSAIYRVMARYADTSVTYTTSNSREAAEELALKYAQRPDALGVFVDREDEKHELVRIFAFYRSAR